jgi:hypothetical protein
MPDDCIIVSLTVILGFNKVGSMIGDMSGLWMVEVIQGSILYCLSIRVVLRAFDLILDVPAILILVIKIVFI